MTDKTKEENYQEHLAAKHAKLITSDDIIDQVVKEGTHHKFYSKVKIIAGEVNEVYDVTLDNNQHIILRISRSGYPNFQQEKWAIEKCKKVGVPVPEILFIKYVKSSNQDLSICLMEKMDGEPLEQGKVEFNNLSLNSRKNLMIQAGEILSKIHSIKTAGFGWIIGAGKAEYKTAQEHLYHELYTKEEILEKAAKKDGIYKLLRNH